MYNVLLGYLTFHIKDTLVDKIHLQEHRPNIDEKPVARSPYTNEHTASHQVCQYLQSN